MLTRCQGWLAFCFCTSRRLFFFLRSFLPSFLLFLSRRVCRSIASLCVGDLCSCDCCARFFFVFTVLLFSGTCGVRSFWAHPKIRDEEMRWNRLIVLCLRHGHASAQEVAECVLVFLLLSLTLSSLSLSLSLSLSGCLLFSSFLLCFFLSACLVLGLVCFVILSVFNSFF